MVLNGTIIAFLLLGLVLISTTQTYRQEVAMEAGSIPDRHGANRTEAERIAKPLLWGIRDREAATPDNQQWQRMGEALTKGDPPADALAAWIQGEGGSEGFQRFEQLLADAPPDPADLPQPLRGFFEAVETPPPWLDRTRLERGVAACALSGKTGMRALRDLGLMAGYQASGINRTLVMTGALERGAARRVAETTQWWMDCTAPGGLEPGADGYRSTLRVRLIHAMVRQQLRQRPDWDSTTWGLPVNQLDMQATYLAFSVLFLMGQKLLGTVLSRQESEDIMHLWRYIGWLMGVEESLLCRTEEEGRIALYRNLASQATADETSQQLGRALMDEPLYRHYPFAQRVRGRWERRVHLSIIRSFVGRRGMTALGLPPGTLPWYPLVFAPANAAWCAANRLTPGGRRRLQRIGRNAQEHQLQTLGA